MYHMVNDQEQREAELEEACSTINVPLSPDSLRFLVVLIVRTSPFQFSASTVVGRTSSPNPDQRTMEKQADDAYGAVSKEPRSEKDISISSLPHQNDELELAAPTEEEMNTLRHVPDKIDWTAYSERLICIFPLFR